MLNDEKNKAEIQSFVEKVKNPKTKIVYIIKHKCFDFLIQKPDPTLIKILFTRFAEVIDIAFRILPTSPRESKRAYRYSRKAIKLIFYNKKLESKIRKNKVFIKFLFSFVFKMEKYDLVSQDLYFSELPRWIVNKRGFLLSKFNNVDFFLKLAKMFHCFSFPNFFQKKLPKCIPKRLVGVGFYDNLFEAITSYINITNVEIGYDIFQRILIFKNFPGFIKFLANENHLRKIIETGINNRNVKTSDLIALLYSNIIGRKKRDYKEIKSIIESGFDFYVSFLLKSELYTKENDGYLRLIIQMIKDKKCKLTSSFNEMLIKLSKDFFKFQTNSFLHNSFSLLLYTLYSNNKLTIQMIQEMSLFEYIINAFETREQNYTSSYFGQLSVISLEILHPLSKKYKLLNRKQWENIVIKKAKENKLIQKKNFGGDLPISRFKSKSSLINIKNIVLLLIPSLILIFIIMLKQIYHFQINYTK